MSKQPNKSLIRVACAEDAMSLMRLDLYNFHPKDVARALSVSTSCIYAIRSGRTRWPREHTFFALAEYLGYAVYLAKDH